MIKIKQNVVESEVLVVGGGIAGLMAAIAAADGGASVVLADKGDTRRSGSGATGNDHFTCYIPEYHQCTVEEYLVEHNMSLVGGNADPKIQTIFAERSFEVVQDWHAWGIDMQPHGEWEFNGHAYPGRKRIFLKYNGYNQKQVLTDEARKRGVRIVNKTPVIEFLTDNTNKVIGAIGLDIAADEPALVLFRTKTIISATGNTSRLYPSITPTKLFNTAHCPANAGGGRAAAYRAGARLINLEIPNTHAGPKYFERCGKATWIGILNDPDGKPVGPFVTKPTRELGDITADVWHSVFTDKMQNGTGPVYMDCSETSPADLEYMRWGLECEGDTSLLDAMEHEGIDLTRHKVEFTRYEPILIGRGIEINEQAATNVTGLYAAGDEVGNFRADISGAAVMGRIAGENAARYAQTSTVTQAELADHEVVAAKAAFCSALLAREAGEPWQDLNAAIQQIMNDYAGVTFVRSEKLLTTALLYLDQLEKKARNTLGVKTAHELMRALECFDLLQIGRLICITASERKETRGLHKRSDYTFTNPLLNGRFLTIAEVEGEPQLSWRGQIK